MSSDTDLYSPSPTKPAAASAFQPTARSKVKRLPDRGAYDRESVYAILDTAFIAHIAYVIDGQPYVTPTSFWREGDQLYWHGSSASRMLRAQSAGLPVCFTVTHVDGLVVARSGFHSSINYRSVMAFGTARRIEDIAAKTAALDAFVERLFPGRTGEIRRPNVQEIKAASVLGMTIEEAAAKVRQGPPKDDEEDYAAPCWAGVLPFVTRLAAPQPDPRLPAGRAVTPDLAAYETGRMLDEVLGQLAPVRPDR